MSTVLYINILSFDTLAVIMYIYHGSKTINNMQRNFQPLF
jgi:hypothetical protein